MFDPPHHVGPTREKLQLKIKGGCTKNMILSSKLDYPKITCKIFNSRLSKLFTMVFSCLGLVGLNKIKKWV